MGATRGFHKFACLKITSAHFYAVYSSVFVHNPDCLQVWFPPALGNAGYILTDTAFTFCLTAPYDTIAYLGALAAVFTYS